MRIARLSLVLLGAFFIQSRAAMAVPFTVVEKPLDATGYGFTSHSGQQHMFEDFSLSSEEKINRIAWYGLFSEGSVANNQSTGNFDVFFFSNSSDLEYLEKFPTPEGTIAKGLPDKPAFYAATSRSAVGAGTGQSDPLQGGDIKRWELDIPTLSLAADNYFISIRASASEPGFFLWNHSTNGADGYSVHGSISPLNEPNFIVSSEVYDTQAFSLERVDVPDGGPGLAAVATLLGLLIAASRPRSTRV